MTDWNWGLKAAAQHCYDRFCVSSEVVIQTETETEKEREEIDDNANAT